MDVKYIVVEGENDVKCESFEDVVKALVDERYYDMSEQARKDTLTRKAAANALKEGTANLIILADDEEFAANNGGFDVSKATIINPKTSEKLQSYIDGLVELRKAKGMTPEQAKELLTTDYMYFACMMVKNGDADGVVSGACHSTANTLRPSLQIIKTAPGTKLVSAFFVMDVPNCEFGENGTFVFGDCGLIRIQIQKNLQQLLFHQLKVLRL